MNLPYQIKIRVFLLLITIISSTVKATEMASNSIVEDDQKRRKLLLYPEIIKKQIEIKISSNSLISYIKAYLSWFVSRGRLTTKFDSSITIRSQHEQIERFPTIPSDIILAFTDFLNYEDQLKLSHVNKIFRSEINEKFWGKKIAEQEYITWNIALPKVKIFFANYFYHKGFGLHPKDKERMVSRTEDIIFLPNFKLAERAIALGFPKGKENYIQVKHKATMLGIAQNRRSNHSSTHSNYPRRHFVSRLYAKRYLK